MILKKKNLVILTKSNVIMRPSRLSFLHRRSASCLVEPDISRVKNTEMRFWKQTRNGNVKEMLRGEKLDRIKYIEQNGEDAFDPTRRTELVFILSAMAVLTLGVGAVIMGIRLWPM